VRSSVIREGNFGNHGEITRITPNSVYYRSGLTSREIRIHRQSVAAVCDTAAEVQALRECDKAAQARISEARRINRIEVEKLVTATGREG
jgi:hypothetical protein